MSKKINYYKIGVFICIAIVFLIILLIALGGSKLFENKRYIETYFDESVQGLQVGSSVKYLGIDIGQVDKIGLLSQIYPEVAAKSKNGSHRYIYVKIAITDDNFTSNKSDTFWKSIPKQVQKGLRARIAPQGLTGGAMVDISFVNPTSNPPLSLQLPKSNAIYIPSTTSTITRLTDAVNHLFNNLNSINSAQIIQNINTLAKTATQAIQAANVKGISKDMRNTLLTIATTANTYKTLAQRLLALSQKKQVGETIDNIADITNTLKQTTIEATKTLKALNRAVISSDQILAQFKIHEQQLLISTSKTARNLQQITSNAKQYPSEVLFGAPPPHLDPSKL